MLKAIGERLRRDGSATFETRHKRKDGVTFPVEVSVRLVTLDQPYSFAISRDITERKRVEEEVQNLQAQLREQAVHDALTGLHNRRYLDETMGRELIRAARYGQPVGIVMCDIDHFKIVNDRYGHPAGDEVLRAVAGLLSTGARRSDIACRYGGEEFVLLFPDMPRDAAYARAEQLRVALAAKRITSGAAGIQITASFGVAVFPEDGNTVDALIGAADLAMYEAKKAGRNRVVVASAGIAPLPAAGRSPAGREST
jgi:diguanylate cyclase (GGDEF)-like protein